MATSLEGVQQKSILVVEDEGLIAQDIQSVLEQLGYCVSGTASSSDEALELVSLARTDLVLMDIKIRGEVDGIQTAEQIRRRFHIPVVYLTAHADSSTVERAKSTEPFGYVIKPFTIADVKVAVEMALTRHRLQQDLEEKEAWFSTVLRSIGDAIIATDCDGNVKFLNAAAESLTGWSSAEAANKPFQDVLQLRDDQGDDQTHQVFLSMHESQTTYFTTGTLVHRNGREHLVISSAAPIRQDDAAQTHGAVMVFRDISDLRKIEQALQETNWFLARSNEHLNQLSYSLSHDLQEPLRNVTIYSGLLAQRYGEALHGSGTEFVQIIQDGCSRMNALLSALQEYYRAGNPGQSANVMTDPSAAASEALLNLRAALEESQAAVRMEELPPVLSHPTALQQVFQNLIGNAIKYRSGQNPEIRVSGARENDFCHFVIEDNGLGFPSDQAESIFGLFKRAHGRDKAGSGIGLATCRRLIEGNGGTIWAESHEGSGAKFHFTLPAAPAGRLS